MGKTCLAGPVALPPACGFLMFGKTSELEQEHLGYVKSQGMFSFPGLILKHALAWGPGTPRQQLGTSRTRDLHTEMASGSVGF